MKFALLIFLLLACWDVSAGSLADQITAQTPSSSPKIDSKVSPIPTISIVAGPLEAERTALLARIKEAEVHGVGIQPYITALLDLEYMVRQGASEKDIRLRLDSIDYALNKQLPQYGKIIDNLGEQRRSKNLMPVGQARVYVLDLVNADRAKYHLSRLSMDSVANKAAQIHSDEMTKVGYCGHWDTFGKKPWQRYTEAGGTDGLGENTATLSGYCLSKDHMFAAEDLELMESSFISEKPPHDGHRLQILIPAHNKLGVGLSCSVNSQGTLYLSLVQEFIDKYGEYSKLPNKIIRGKPFEVSGSLFPGVKLHSVEVDCEQAPKPITKEELRKTYSTSCSWGDYVMATLSPKDKQDVKVWSEGRRQYFSVRVEPDENWMAGLYYVLVSVTISKGKAPTVVSSRTIIMD